MAKFSAVHGRFYYDCEYEPDMVGRVIWTAHWRDAGAKGMYRGDSAPAGDEASMIAAIRKEVDAWLDAGIGM